jgi:hypothetical protein
MIDQFEAMLGRGICVADKAWHFSPVVPCSDRTEAALRRQLRGPSRAWCGSRLPVWDPRSGALGDAEHESSAGSAQASRPMSPIEAIKLSRKKVCYASGGLSGTRISVIAILREPKRLFQIESIHVWPRPHAASCSRDSSSCRGVGVRTIARQAIWGSRPVRAGSRDSGRWCGSTDDT